MFKCRLKVFLTLPTPEAPAESQAEALDRADRWFEEDYASIAEALKCKALKNSFYNGFSHGKEKLEAEAWFDFAGDNLDEAAEAVKLLLEIRKEADEAKLADRLWLTSFARLEFWS